MAQLLSVVQRHTELPPQYRRPENDRPRLHQVLGGINIPAVDLGSADKSSVVSQISNACSTYGFFQVYNHGVNKGLIRRMRAVSREFFALSPEKKKLYSADPTKKVRLSTSFNVPKETMHNWRDFLRLHYYPLETYVPEWPANPPSFSGRAAVKLADWAACLIDGIKNHGILESTADAMKKTTRLLKSSNVMTEKVRSWKDFLCLNSYPLEDYVQDWRRNPPAFRDVVEGYCRHANQLDRNYVQKMLGNQAQLDRDYSPCPDPDHTIVMTKLLQDHVLELQASSNDKTYIMECPANSLSPSDSKRKCMVELGGEHMPNKTPEIQVVVHSKDSLLQTTAASGSPPMPDPASFPVAGSNSPVSMLLICFLVASQGLILGYGIGLSGGDTSKDSFLIKYFPGILHKLLINDDINHYCIFNTNNLAIFTSSLYLAALFVSIIGLIFPKVFRSKGVILIGGLLYIAGALIVVFAKNYAMLVAGRIFFGLSMGIANLSVPFYLSEFVPENMRHKINYGFQIMISFGILVSIISHYFTTNVKGAWVSVIKLASMVAPALMATLGLWYLPRDHQETADNNQCANRGTNSGMMEYNDQEPVQDPGTIINENKHLLQLTKAILISFFQQLTGFNAITIYAPILLKTVGFESEAILMRMVILGIVNLVLTILSVSIVDHWINRKSLFRIGRFLMLVGISNVGTLIGNQLATVGVRQPSNKLFPFICIYVAGYSLSWGPLGSIKSSEMFPIGTMSWGKSVNAFISILCTFLVIATFPTFLCYMKFTIFYFYTLCVYIMTPLAIWIETDNLTDFEESVHMQDLQQGSSGRSDHEGALSQGQPVTNKGGETINL